MITLNQLLSKPAEKAVQSALLCSAPTIKNSVSKVTRLTQDYLRSPFSSRLATSGIYLAGTAGFLKGCEDIDYSKAQPLYGLFIGMGIGRAAPVLLPASIFVGSVYGSYKVITHYNENETSS